MFIIVQLRHTFAHQKARLLLFPTQATVQTSNSCANRPMCYSFGIVIQTKKAQDMATAKKAPAKKTATKPAAKSTATPSLEARVKTLEARLTKLEEHDLVNKAEGIYGTTRDKVKESYDENPGLTIVIGLAILVIVLLIL